MLPSTINLAALLEGRIRALALTRRPSTVTNYRAAVHHFLSALRGAFTPLPSLSELRRDPHLLTWFIAMAEQQPPLSSKTRWNYLHSLRRLLYDLEADGHAVAPQLIGPHDFPPLPRYLPRALSLQDDQQLQAELSRRGDLASNALLLTRLTGIRIGECVDLSLDCLRQLGPETWALHVPIGKLHNERLVPADAAIRQIVARILELRVAGTPLPTENFLLPHDGRQSKSVSQRLRFVLADVAQHAGCSGPVTPHQMRHSFASEMIRLGVGVPALMQLLGHKDIRMTMRYVQVTQLDLQREFHAARRIATARHQIPVLALPDSSITAGLPAIRKGLATVRHLLEMYRRQITDDEIRCTLQRLDRRLLAVAEKIKQLTPDGK